MKIPKIGSVILLGVFVLLFACDDGGSEDPGIVVPEVPDDIIPTKPCSTLYTDIEDMFVPSQNNQQAYPEFFAENALKNIVLKENSEVYVSFISSGATFDNSFGWYSYKGSTPPKSTADFTWNIIFANVSEDVLEQGDMVRLGNGEFEAGTTIGFFLIMRGWEDGVVRYKNKVVHFTDQSYNSGGYQQHVLFKQSNCGDIVLSFEDKPVGPNSDLDFNDIIFTIADNQDDLETTRFDLEDIVVK